MKVRDVQRFLSVAQELTTSTLDHLADQFADATNMGDEFVHLGDFAAKWKKLSRSGRALFVEQMLKSAALVAMTSVATRLGVKIASKRQKELRKAVLMAADFLAPAAARKVKKKGKKLSKKAKKKLKEVVP